MSAPWTDAQPWRARSDAAAFERDHAAAVTALRAEHDEGNEELRTQDHVADRLRIRAQHDVSELRVSGCPQEATDSDVLQRIRADVNAARRRNILYNVAETDVVSCVRAVEPPRRRAGEKKAQKAAPHGTSRFIVVRGAALKEYLMRDAQIVMPARAQWSARDRRPPPLVDLTFKESGRRQSEGKDEATETLLDVCKLQIVDCMADADDPSQPMKGTVLFEAPLESAALRAGVRHMVFTLPPQQDATPDDSEAADSWTAQLGPAQPARYRTRISVELRSISAAHLEQQACLGGDEGDAVAMRLRHPPLLTKQREVDDSSLPDGQEMGWIRVPEITRQKAFSCPTAHLRLVSTRLSALDPAASAAYFEAHRNVASLLREVGLPVPRRVREIELVRPGDAAPWDCVPETPAQRRNKRLPWKRLGRAAAYALATLTHEGHLRPRDVPRFIERVIALDPAAEAPPGRFSDEWVENIIVHIAGLLPRYAKCNDGTRALATLARIEADSGAHAAASSSGVAAAERDANDALGIVQRERDKAARQRREIRTRRAIVTPTRLLPLAPSLEASNRILRQYTEFSDRFLRLAFADESLDRIFHTELSEPIVQWVSDTMRNGFYIGGAKYRFLAFSSSQLREHGCWMYADPTAEERKAHLAAQAHLPEEERVAIPLAKQIREKAGMLDGIQVPAKWAARLGQCFSTTSQTIEIAPDEECEIPDIWTEREVDPECFTDGVGVITSAGMARAMRMHWETHDRPARMKRVPSAIQIRFGGAKGMLCLWDGHKDMAPGAIIGLRGSMVKFESHSRHLEVCTFAAPLPFSLNRQIIMALRTLGVPDETFLDIYAGVVERLDCIEVGGRDAERALQTLGCYAGADEPSDSPNSGLAATMVKAGFVPTREPFLLSLCSAIRGSILRGIQERCKLPMTEGINLLGVCDESGTLQAGQVHFQYYARDANGLLSDSLVQLPPGTRVVASRSPCLSSADLRVLTVADPRTLAPQVRRLENVLVFSQLGARPESCLMSGGDLDGDLYFVVWSTKVVPSEEDEPLDYTPGTKPAGKRGRGVKVADVAEFFASFMKNDQLGRIANAHLAFAEQELLSGCTRHHACQRLVQLHSTAVDFAKTGVPVDVDEINELTRDLRYPDYMGKPKRISFESASAVGSIWRDAKRLPLAIRGRDGARGMDSALLLEGRRRYRALAQTLVWEYNRRLANIMRAYGAFDEGEVMCGRVAQFFNSSRREKISEVQERLNREVAELTREAQGECAFELEEESDSDEDAEGAAFRVPRGGGGAAGGGGFGGAVRMSDENCVRASAFYEAAYKAAALVEERGGGRGGRHIGALRSFPWRVAPHLLLHIKRRAEAGDALEAASLSVAPGGTATAAATDVGTVVESDDMRSESGESDSTAESL